MLMSPRVSRREWRCAKWEGGRERERLGGEGEGLVGRGDGMAKMGCVWNRGQTWFQTNLEPFRTIRDRFGRNGDGDGAKGVGGERGATTSWGGAEANGRGLGGRGEEG